MRKMRNEKGITIITLVITIAVLVILAFSIVSSIKNQGIITYAETAKTQYGEKQDEEQLILKDFEDSINDGESDVNKNNETGEEYINITLTGSSVLAGTTGTIGYIMNVETNGTIKETNIQAQIINVTSNAVAGVATVEQSGSFYRILIDRSKLPLAKYKIKVLEGAFVTEKGTSSSTTISTDTFVVGTQPGIQLPYMPLE